MKRGKNYRNFVENVNRQQEYDLGEAIGMVQTHTKTKFDATLEVHFNLGVDPRHSDQVVRGTVVLPHGTGKTVRVLVFAKGELEKAARDAGAEFVGAEEYVQKIQEGWLDFDAVVATPDMMPLVGRIARVLGPRGLMPSPKAGTVSMDVSKVVKEIKAGKIAYRVDKGANVHAPVGKLSFSKDNLEENVKAFVESVVKAKPSSSKGVYVKSLTIAATMSPGIRINRAIAR